MSIEIEQATVTREKGFIGGMRLLLWAEVFIRHRCISDDSQDANISILSARHAIGVSPYATVRCQKDLPEHQGFLIWEFSESAMSVSSS